MFQKSCRQKQQAEMMPSITKQALLSGKEARQLWPSKGMPALDEASGTAVRLL